MSSRLAVFSRRAVSQWNIVHSSGSAAEFHQHTPDGPFSPTIWIHRVEQPALVLGSTQGPEDLDAPGVEAKGWEVCQRRSGGGLVVLIPGASVWIDVFIPPHHAHWSDDIGVAGLWVGEAWAATLNKLSGRSDAELHRGRLLRPTAGRRYCFAGLGPGEVTVGGHKVVGLSQRRSRAGARFQSLYLASSIATSSAIVDELAPHCSDELRQLFRQTTEIGWPAGSRAPDLSLVAEEFCLTVEGSTE